MTIDTSAFDRFKNKEPKTIDVSAFGGDKVTVQPKATVAKPKGVTMQVASKLPSYVAKATGDYMREESARQSLMSTPEKFKRTFVEQPAKVVKFLVQGVASGVVGLGRSAQELIATPLGKKEAVRQSFKKSASTDEVLFGGPVDTYQQMTEKVQGFLDKSPDATNFEKKYLAPTLGIAMLAADAFPSKPNAKKAAADLFEDLAKSVDPVQIEKRLVDFGIDADIAKRTAPKLVETTTSADVRQALIDDAGDNLTNIMRVAEDLPDTTPNRVDLPEPTPADRTPGVEVPTVRDTARELEIKLDSLATERDILKETLATNPARQLQKFMGKGDNSLAQIQKTGEVKGTRAQELDSMVTELGFENIDEAQVAMDQYRKGRERLFNLEQELKSGKDYLKRAQASADDFDRIEADYYNKTIVDPDGQIDEIGVRDLIRKDLRSLRPTRATGDLTGRNLRKEMENNIERYNTKIPDAQIRETREQMLLGKESIDEAVARSRGIVTDVQSIEDAKKIQGTLQDVIDLPKGTPVTKEQYTAIEQIVQNQREIVKKLQIAFNEGSLSGGAAERRLLTDLNPEYADKTDAEILRLALQESTLKLKKAEIVLLGIRSEAGRSLQATKQYVEGVDNRLRILFGLINNNKKMDDVAKQAMVETIIKLDTADNKGFLKAIDELIKPDMFDKVAEWSVAAKLWNPTTHIVNFGGNALRQVLDIGIKTVTNPMMAKADMAGALHGLRVGTRNAINIFTNDGYASQMSKYIELGGTGPAIGGKLGTAARTPFRALSAGDEIFRNMAYQRKLYRDAYKTAKNEKLSGSQLDRRMEELLNTPTFKMMDDATAEAKHLTFQDDLGRFTSQINQMRDPRNYSHWYEKLGAVGIRLFLPFLKTPTNLFKQSVDFSLLGIGKNWTELKAAAKAGDNEKVGTILGEAILGTALTAYIAMEALDGNVTGGVPSNPADKDRFYREKKLPYAIKFGDTWYQYQRLDPLALVIGMTADMANNEDTSILGLIGTMSQNLQDKTYLAGVSDIMKMLTGEDWEREYAFKSAIMGAAFPSFVGHIARSSDPVVRVTDTIGQRLIAQTPGLSEELPARVNVLGYNVERANKGLNYFFNPIQTEKAMIDPVTKELMAINKSISVPNKTFTRKGVDYDLTPAEYEDFARFTGVKLRSELKELFKKPAYKNDDDEKKARRIDALRTDIMDEWKDEYVKEKTEKGNRAQQIRNVIQGKPANAPAELDTAEKIRAYFLGN